MEWKVDDGGIEEDWMSVEEMTAFASWDASVKFDQLVGWVNDKKKKNEYWLELEWLEELQMADKEQMKVQQEIELDSWMHEDQEQKELEKNSMVKEDEKQIRVELSQKQREVWLSEHY